MVYVHAHFTVYLLNIFVFVCALARDKGRAERRRRRARVGYAPPFRQTDLPRFSLTNSPRSCAPSFGEVPYYGDDIPTEDSLPEPEPAPKRSDEAEARVALFVNPPDANIYVDDVYKGQGQFVGTLPPGEHTVRFEYQGFNTVQEALRFDASDGPAYLVIHMRPSRLTDVQFVGRDGGWVDTFDSDIAAWSFTGGGAVLLVGGIVLLAMDGEPSCAGECGGVFETSAAGATLTALGASSLTVGTTLFLWDELAGHRPSSPSVPQEQQWSVGAAPISQDQQWSGGRVWLKGYW